MNTESCYFSGLKLRKPKNMNNWIVLLLIIFSTSIINSQSVTGVVINEQLKPLQDAYIIHKNTEIHTHSNEQGLFEMDGVSVGDTLKISHLSYEGLEVVVFNQEEKLEIILKSKTVNIEDVVISSDEINLNVITDLDLKISPVNSSQEVLRKVPGLFIGQHAGGGKAEQIFLRGFDIDHGTDIQITVDGMPVNMVSHAHGQGYADLHFVIAETIDKVDFGKGSYYGDKGNFNTAGYVDFRTKNRLENSLVKLELGQFGTQRLLGMVDLLNSSNHHAYIASEYLLTDGPFESSQDFHRINLLGKYHGILNNKDELGVSFSHFTSKWDASGQIPQRAVNSGLISRFGSIDDTEGGETSRNNLSINHVRKLDENATIKTDAFVSQYNFLLYSNFKFFLEDFVNGDQIMQRENRSIYGLRSELSKRFNIRNVKANWISGIGLRNDQSRGNELSHTLNRTEVLDQIQIGDINEINLSSYTGLKLTSNEWTINPSIRIDHFVFQYNNGLIPAYDTEVEKHYIISPKLNVSYTPSEKLQLYLKTGKGFHSNDTRVVIANEGYKILPASYGGDLGTIWKPSSKMLVNVAYWYLFLEQEFVYVGDAGVVEPSGKTTRQGVDLSFRYQMTPWLFWNVDGNYTVARADEEPVGENYIPLAPDLTATSGLSVIHPSGFYGGVNVRHMGDRPANEDYSLTADGYTVTDLNLGYKMNRLGLGVQVQNLFNVDWNETQFATESRLQNESTSVEEIHFTPGTPFFVKGSIEYRF